MRKCHLRENNYFCPNCEIKELKKQRVLQHSSNTVSSLEVDIRPQKRSGLTITNPLSHLQEGHVSVATNTLLASNRGKRILDYFSIFEIGSTSGTYDDDATANTLTSRVTSKRGMYLSTKVIIYILILLYVT
uniref:Uncharacterized protein LOC104245981 n=1 Tax=Nicotiana sylvestris TaxID=4096 RepID=A0A1U7YA80_NICSY|nr:PREDICTED: uncharacterized protein LOC104245981 [Nicotiana sylvestris]